MLPVARELRESIDRAIAAVVAGEPVPADAVVTIDSWLPAAACHECLELGAGGVPVVGRAPAEDPVTQRSACGAATLTDSVGSSGRSAEPRFWRVSRLEGRCTPADRGAARGGRPHSDDVLGRRAPSGRSYPRSQAFAFVVRGMR
jgi:hypothetical protein